MLKQQIIPNAKLLFKQIDKSYFKTKNNVIKNNNKTIDLVQELRIIRNNVNFVIAERYNSLEKEYNIFLIDLLILNKNCRFVTQFKDCMILDYIEEFFKR